jgi:hypothetical protein
MIARILTALVGLGIAVVGGFFLWLEMQGATVHKQQIYLFAGIMCGGTALLFLTIAPATVFDRVKIVLTLKLPTITIGSKTSSTDTTSSTPSEEGK